MRWLAIVFLCGALVAACGDSDDGLQTIEIPEECAPSEDSYVFADEIAIANEILAESTTSVFFDREARDSLAAKITAVLESVRENFPRSFGIAAPPYDRRQIYISLQGELADRILADAETPMGQYWVTHTGDERFDALSEELGLKALEVNWHNPDEPEFRAVSALACLDDLVNPSAAAAAYTQLDSVSSAEPSVYGGDASSIDMRMRGDTWYVVVREGGGDCFAGCTGSRYFFFRARDGVVEEVPEEVAAGESLFHEVAAEATWGREQSEWPTPAPEAVRYSP